MPFAGRARRTAGTVTVYVANTAGNTVTPIRAASNTARRPIRVGQGRPVPERHRDDKTGLARARATWPARAGRRYPADLRPGVPSTATSPPGAMTAPWRDDENMALQLAPEEPEAGPWRAELLSTVVNAVTRRRPDQGSSGRPAVLAIDGRSNNGKTTLAARISELVPGSVVIHTDDIAWAHSRFGWADLLIDGILVPVHHGRAVSYRPPRWDEHGREGSIEVPAGCPLLIIEGDGAGRREVAHLIDTVIWVQADEREAGRRTAARAANRPAADLANGPSTGRRSTRTGGWPRKYPSTPPSGPGNAPTLSSAAPRRPATTRAPKSSSHRLRVLPLTRARPGPRSLSRNVLAIPPCMRAPAPPRAARNTLDDRLSSASSA